MPETAFIALVQAGRELKTKIKIIHSRIESTTVIFYQNGRWSQYASGLQKDGVKARKGLTRTSKCQKA